MKSLLNAKRILKLATVGLPTSALTVALFLGSVSPSYAASQAPRKCTLATLQGRYIFANDGSQMIGKTWVPFADAGQETYDGKGKLSGVVSTATGKTLTKRVRYTGTYTITPECIMTYTTTDTTGVTTHFDQFIPPNGKEFTFVQTDSGYVSSGWEKHI